MDVQTITRGTASLGAINKLGLKRCPSPAMYIGLEGRDVSAVIWRVLGGFRMVDGHFAPGSRWLL